jgi:hypothetical protein
MTRTLVATSLLAGAVIVGGVTVATTYNAGEPVTPMSNSTTTTTTSTTSTNAPGYSGHMGY